MKNTRKIFIGLLGLITLIICSLTAIAANEKLPVITSATVKNSGNGVLIKWDIPENADSFVIMRKTEGKDFTPLAELGKKKSYQDKSAESGVSYTYAVVPYKDKLPGKYTPTPSITCVNQPELISVRSTAEGVELKWKEIKGADRYTVYYKVDGDKGWTRITHIKDGCSYLHKNAPDGKELIYTVVARNGSFCSSYDKKGISLDYMKTPAVTDICSVINGIKVTWEKTEAAKSYIIYRRGAKEKWTYLTSVSSKKSSYTDTTVIPGKTYAYTVRAENGQLNSAYTSGKPYRYIPENSITSIGTLCDGLTLRWKESPYAKKYKLLRKEGNGDPKLIATIKSAKTLSYTDTTVKHGKSYTYILITVSGSYESTADTTGRSYTFVKSPDAINAVISSKGYTVSWNKVSKATNYYIYRRTSSSDSWKKIARTGDVQSYNDKSADKGKSYYYCVRAGISSKFFSNYGDSVKTSKIDPNKKMIALTYDDGPHNTNTSRILDTLEKYGARATFFVVGERIDSNSAPLIRASKLGCEIGNHTYNHMNIPSYSASQIKSNLQKTDDLVKKYTGRETTVMRPPGGATSSRSLAAVNKPVIMWSVDTLDWKHRTASRTVSHIKSHAYDGAIILMHDLYPATASATETIVPWLINNGYQLVTVTELLEYRGITPRNGTVYRQARP